MNTFGKNVQMTIFGESHGEAIGIVISGLPANLTIDHELIKKNLFARTTNKQISTKRSELDEYKIISGYFNEKTTGAPLTFIIENKDVDSSSYKKGVIRPNHADYPLYVKHDGANDYRGGGTSSGRLTALLVIAGSICEQILRNKNINVYSYIKQIKDIKTSSFTDAEKLEILTNKRTEQFMLEENKELDAINLIKETANIGDSLPSVAETLITGVEVGLGEPFFDSFESRLSHLLFSIPGLKSVSFGSEDLNTIYSSDAIDELTFIDGAIKINSSNQGGINGGITNGGLIKFATSFKAPASISKELNSVNVLTHENIKLSTTGRHDPIIGIRALPVLNAVAYFTILDLLLEAKKYEAIR